MKFLKKIGSHLAGAFAGLFTGLFAGFIPGFHYILKIWVPPCSNNYGLLFVLIFALAAYLISLPFFMIYQAGRGAIQGALKGLMAGLSWPKSLNEEFYTADMNKQLYQSAKITDENCLLSQAEVQKFQQLLVHFPQAKEEYDLILKQYEERLNLLADITLTTDKKMPTHPIIIGVIDPENNKLKYYIIEKNWLLTHLQKYKDIDVARPTITINGKKMNIVEVSSFSAAHALFHDDNRIFSIVATIRRLLRMPATDVFRILGRDNSEQKKKLVEDKKEVKKIDENKPEEKPIEPTPVKEFGNPCHDIGPSISLSNTNF
jgi:hypothetical protein